MSHEALSPQQFFHGSAHRIVRGGVVKPRSVTKAETWLDAGSAEHAHASNDLGQAAWYGTAAATNKGLKHPAYVYQVKPIANDLEPDPADPTSVRSKSGFEVTDWVPKSKWSKALKKMGGM